MGRFWMGLLFFGLSVAGAAGQDDPDVPLPFDAKVVDLAYAEDGTAVIAFVRPFGRQDQIWVRSSQDLGLTWSTLFVNTIGNVRTIERVSVALAQGGPAGREDRVFVGVLGTWNDPAKPMAFYGMLSGPSSKTPWTTSNCLDVPGYQYVPYDPQATIDCAVVPLVDRGSDYAVALAYDWEVRPGRSLYLTWSLDHGDSIHDTYLIAGNGGDTLDTKHRYSCPSLVGDSQNRELLLAFHDEDEETVLVLNAPARSHVENGNTFKLFHETTRGGPREHHPVISVYKGEFNLACLVGQRGPFIPTFELTWFHGDTLTGTVRELRDPRTGAPLAFEVMSRPDLIVRRSDAFLCALTPRFPDQGVVLADVTVFEGNRRDGSEMVITTVNDDVLGVIGGDPSRLAPRVGVAPVAASPRRAQSYAWIRPGVNSEVVIDP